MRHSFTGGYEWDICGEGKGDRVRSKRGRCAVTAVAVLTVALGFGQASARADVSTRADPTWGTDGRVTAVLRVGSTAYIGGEFANVVDRNGNTYAKPAGRDRRRDGRRDRVEPERPRKGLQPGALS